MSLTLDGRASARRMIIDPPPVLAPGIIRDLGDESNHIVQFYEDEEALCEVVTEFLEAGLLAGDPLVVIATESHGLAICNRLGEKGFDVEEARASGQFMLLNAKETLAEFMVGSMPDRELFRAVIGGLLEKATAGRHPVRVRAFGEMVDLLWTEGNVRGALRLEELWNELQKTHSFALLCAYVMASFYNETVDLRRVCSTHTHVLAPARERAPRSRHEAFSANVAPHHTQALLAEIAQRKEVEKALRESLRELGRKEEELRDSQRQLRDFVENATIGLHWAGPDGTILWANRAELELLGYSESEYIGRNITEVHADRAVIDDLLTRLSRHEELHNHEARLLAKDGSIRHVLISSNVCWQDGRFSHTRCFTRDITERKRLEDAREAASRRTERLMKITAAIADAVEADEVYEAVVQQAASALGASSAALWVIAENGRTAGLVRAVGYSAQSLEMFRSVPIQMQPSFPGLDVIQSGQPIWIGSQLELIEQYPNLASAVSPGRSYRISCLPVVVHGRTLGSLNFTFDDAPPDDEAQRNFLLIVARYCGQALERLRLLEAERKSRVHAELLYRLARSLIDAGQVEQVFEAALDALAQALHTDRSAILAYDRDGVMRFRAWRGLSEEYRRAVEGHSPWSRDVRGPVPILVEDAERDPSMTSFLPLFRREGIGALGFIPLVSVGKLIGKFMVYYEQPCQLEPHQLEIAMAIANHVAAAMARFTVVDELQQTVRFNEMFAGILGHDLRNPLGAIMMAGQLAIRQTDNEKLTRPLNRIINSGERMNRMIDQLLDFTRVRVGEGLPLTSSPLDLAPLLRQVVDELESANPTRVLTLTQHGDTRGHGDPDRLCQVFSNLAANALQHGVPEHGVQICLDGRDSERLRIEFHNMGSIPAAFLPRMFEPMVGGHTRRDGSQGLGLGLHITREVVKGHGGEIEVQSSEAAGTTIVVLLPRHECMGSR